MNPVDIAIPRLRNEEGFRAHAYRDTNGLWTIGYGFNLDAGISEYAAAALLEAQVDEIHYSLMKFPWYAGLDAPRQSVLLDIAFNAGVSGLLKFPKMLAAIGSADWKTASAECSVSDPKLSGRYQMLAQTLLTGVP